MSNAVHHVEAPIIEAEYTTVGFVAADQYVLVVDDDYAILSVILMLLETEGYAGLGFLQSRKVQPFLEQVRTLDTAEQGMHLPSVILLDLMMPGVSGYDIATWLTHQQWHIPVIAMSADPALSNADVVYGASDWLGKPFHIDTLLHKVERYLSPSLII